MPGIQQSPNNPSFNIDVDRTRAQYVGLTERDVTNSLVVDLAGSCAGRADLLAQSGQWRVVLDRHADAAVPDRLAERAAKHCRSPRRSSGDAADPRRHRQHHTIDVERGGLPIRYPADRCRSTRRRRAAISARSPPTSRRRSRTAAKEVPKGSSIVLLGQVQTMNSAFSGLLFGLLAAVVLIYLLIVVNFQSWSDPFVIITALPAALAGIVWMLFATQTTLSVPALTGAIMCMGVATANSDAGDQLRPRALAELGDPVAAAIEAGFMRFRPVLMTALAMIIGMAPMALGLGEGGEQNAPLGRAVIGGLVFATIATLMFVPVVFSMVHKKQGAKAAALSETSHAR